MRRMYVLTRKLSKDAETGMARGSEVKQVPAWNRVAGTKRMRGSEGTKPEIMHRPLPARDRPLISMTNTSFHDRHNLSCRL